MQQNITTLATWASFDAIMAVYKQGGFDGIFFALPLDRSLIGGDFDDCLDPDTKLIIAPEIANIIKRLDTYTELSPSGSGLRVIGFGCKPHENKSRQGNIELYDNHRFLSFTGHHYEGRPDVGK